MNNTITCRYNNPGKWEILLPFTEVGIGQEWVGVVDAREPGTYELRVVADHHVAHTRGRVTVRAVAGKGAHVHLSGLIRIAREAQDTDDFLELRVLTLDEAARATAEPKLEIEANQVKASHAASVGPVDPEQILYLESRGLTSERAVALLVDSWLMIES